MLSGDWWLERENAATWLPEAVVSAETPRP